MASCALDRGFHYLDLSLCSHRDHVTRTWWARTAPHWKEFCQMVDAARAWWLEQTPSESYLANCRNALVDMNPHRKGLIIGAIREFMKAQDLVMGGKLMGRRRHEPMADAWLGSPQDELKDLPVELLDVRAATGTFGPCFFVSFRDDDGHCLSWRASSNPFPSPVTIGARFRLSGTVKEHATRCATKRQRATKQTVLTHCTLALDPLRAVGAAA